MTVGSHWVVGRGGLLGSAVAARIPLEQQFEARKVSWSSNQAHQQLASEARRYLAGLDGTPWVVFWCAGAGIIGTAEASLEQEITMLRTLLNELGAGGPGSFFLASSAGGVYGNSPDKPITESTAPRPISPYGRNKLRQEELVDQWARASGVAAVIGRISNLYGPGQSLDKPQGLVSQVCVSTLRRDPISIYVSLDTLRDYLYVDDCAEVVIKALNLAQTASRDSEPVTKIIASGQSVSIGAVIGEATRVLGRRPNCVFMPSPKSTQQGSVLSFRSIIWPAIDRRPNTPLAVGMAQTAQAIRRGFATGAVQGSEGSEG